MASLLDTLTWLIDVPSPYGSEERLCDELEAYFEGHPVTRVGNGLVVGERGHGHQAAQRQHRVPGNLRRHVFRRVRLAAALLRLARQIDLQQDRLDRTGGPCADRLS